MGAFDRELLRRLKNDLCAKRFRTAVRTAKQLWRFRTRNSSITLRDQAFQESCLRYQVVLELIWCTNLGYREAQAFLEGIRGTQEVSAEIVRFLDRTNPQHYF